MYMVIDVGTTYADDVDPFDFWQHNFDPLEQLRAIGERPDVGRAAYQKATESLRCRSPTDHQLLPVLPGPACESDTSSDASSAASSSNANSAQGASLRRHHHRQPCSPITEPDSDFNSYKRTFEDVDAVVFEVFGPDRRIALDIVRRMHQLPGELRALMYGFGSKVQQFAGCSGSTTTSPPSTIPGNPAHHQAQTECGAGSLEASSGETLGKRQAEGGLGGEVRRRRTRQRAGFTYACPFNRFWESKFRRQFGPQGSGDRFSTCEGPGWSDIRHLGDHVEKVHLRRQCTRCWKTWATDDEWRAHVMQEPRVDCPNNSDAIDNIESVTFDTYKEIKAVLKKHRGTAASKTTSLSDWEKWYKIKRIIFPPERYLSFPDPKHPFYQDPESNLADPLTAEQEMVQKSAELIVAALAEKAVRENRASEASQYLFSGAEVVDVVKKVHKLWKRSSYSTRLRVGPSGDEEPSQAARRMTRDESHLSAVTPGNEQEDMTLEEWRERFEPLLQAL